MGMPLAHLLILGAMTASLPAISRASDEPPVRFPPGLGERRIYLDAGHGYPGNSGNQSCFCTDEQDFNLRVGRSLKSCLEASGHFRVLLSRKDNQGPRYAERLRAARRFGAELILSIHSDVRGQATYWRPLARRLCPRNRQCRGFAVLYADQEAQRLVSSRLALARAVARQMARAGFRPYDGEDYVGLYAADPRVPGVFVDRHQPARRIYFLNRPAIPSVIIETHQALDPASEIRWRLANTHKAFCTAVTAALVEYLAH